SDWDEMERVAVLGQQLKDEFLVDVDRDTDAYNALMAAIRMPKTTEDERTARGRAVEQATRGATLVPLGVLRRAVAALDLAESTSRRGNPNSLSDAGVAALAGLCCAEGAFYNVRINLKSLTEAESAHFVASTTAEAASLLAEAQQRADRIRAEVRTRLG